MLLISSVTIRKKIYVHAVVCQILKMDPVDGNKIMCLSQFDFL